MPEKNITREDLVQLIKDVLSGDDGKVVSELVDARMKHAAETNANPLAQAAKAAAEAEARISKAKVGQFFRCLAHATKGGVGSAVDFAKHIGADDAVVKAVSESTGAAGGYLVAPEMGKFIDLLGTDAAVRKLGADVLPMPGGSLTLPGGATGATANWVGENAVAPSSQPTAKQITMTAKKLMVIVPISNEMLNDAGARADAWVQREATRASVRAEDLAFIRGIGSGNAPRGLKYRVNTSTVLPYTAPDNWLHIIHAGARATAAEVIADLGRMLAALANHDIPMERCGWIFAKRTEWFLKTLLTTTDARMFPEMAQGLLLGFPFASTTQIPINLTAGGGGSDESEVYLADFVSCVIGDTGEYVAEVLPGAAYYDSVTGAVVSAVSQDQTVVVIKRRVDFTSLYDGQDIAYMDQCDWGT